MAPKDEEGSSFPKAVLEWLSWVGAIAAGLATILGFIFGEENAKLIAYGVAVSLALGSGLIFYFRRRRAKQREIKELLEPLSPTATLRGLLPFEENDPLPGRARDVQEVFTLIASRDYRFGVLWGESGCGKTSLIRAGLIPRLREKGFLPVYLARPTADPRREVYSVIQKERPELAAGAEMSLKELIQQAASKGAKILIIFDQFEEFFLTHRAPGSRTDFIEWLGATTADPALPLAFLISIRADYFAQLQSLSPAIPEPTSTLTTYQLQNFDAAQAQQILNEAAKIDALSLQPELIKALVNDLEHDGLVRPAELQIVASRLKRKNLLSVNQYEIAGRANGILRSYISDEINRSASIETARLILRAVVSEDGAAKSPEDLTLDDIVAAVTGGIQQGNLPPGDQRETVRAILKQFVSARILINSDEDRYNLVHDYLAPYARVATAGLETGAERANRLLKRYIAEYKEDTRVRIPLRRLREIQKNASRELASGETATELMRKSLLSSILYSVASAFSVPLLIVLALYLYLSSSYYLSFIPAPYTNGPRQIVIRSGHPEWKFLPGFDRVRVVTDFHEDNLTSVPSERETILSEKVSGFWFQRQSGYILWGDQLVQKLDPAPQVWALDWLGQKEVALTRLLADVVENSSSNRNDVDRLSVVALTNPDQIEPEMVKTLLDLIVRPGARPGSPEVGAQALTWLVSANPQAVQPETALALADLEKSVANYGVRRELLKSLVIYTQFHPQSTTDPLVEALVKYSLSADEAQDQEAALDALALVQRQNPQAIRANMPNRLWDMVIDPKTNSRARKTAADILVVLGDNGAGVSDLTGRLFALLRNQAEPTQTRLDAAEALAAIHLVDPSAVDPQLLSAMVDLLLSIDPPLYRHSYAAYAEPVLMDLARAQDQPIPPALVKRLVDLATDPDEDRAAVNHAIEILEVLARAAPRTVLPYAEARLVDLITTPREDSSPSAETADALSRLFALDDRLISPAIPQNLLEYLLHFSQETPDVSPIAGEALRVMAQDQPNPPSSATLQTLMAVLDDESAFNEARITAAYSLAVFAAATPVIVQSDMIPAVIALIRLRPNDHREMTSLVTALEQLAKASQPGGETAVVESLVEVAADPYSYEARDSAAAALVNLVAEKPGQTRALAALLASVNIYDLDSKVLIDAVNVLSAQDTDGSEIAGAYAILAVDRNLADEVKAAAQDALNRNGSLSTGEITRILVDQVIDHAQDSSCALAAEALLRMPDVDSEAILARSAWLEQYGKVPSICQPWRIRGVLAKGYVSQAKTADADTDTNAAIPVLLDLLDSPGDDQARQLGAYALFLQASTEPDQKDKIRQSLQGLSQSHLPHLRMAANRTLEMMVVLDWVQEAKAHPERVPLIRSRITQLQDTPENYLKFAAMLAAYEIDRFITDLSQ